MPDSPLGVDDLEDLTRARLVGPERDELLEAQTECVLSFNSDQGDPSAVVLSFLVHEGRFWFTSVDGRAQVRGVDRDPRACVVVSSTGTGLEGRRMLSLRGRASVHREPEAHSGVLERIAERLAPSDPDEFLRILRSPGRIVIEFVPLTVVASHDSRRMAGDGRGGRPTASLRGSTTEDEG